MIDNDLVEKAVGFRLEEADIAEYKCRGRKCNDRLDDVGVAANAAVALVLWMALGSPDVATVIELMPLIADRLSEADPGSISDLLTGFESALRDLLTENRVSDDLLPTAREKGKSYVLDSFVRGLRATIVGFWNYSEAGTRMIFETYWRLLGHVLHQKMSIVEVERFNSRINSIIAEAYDGDEDGLKSIDEHVANMRDRLSVPDGLDKSFEIMNNIMGELSIEIDSSVRDSVVHAAPTCADAAIVCVVAVSMMHMGLFDEDQSDRLASIIKSIASV